MSKKLTCQLLKTKQKINIKLFIYCVLDMAPITLIAILIYKFYILFTVISNILSNSTPIFFHFMQITQRKM